MPELLASTPACALLAPSPLQDGRPFAELLRGRLAEVEVLAAREVQRLESALARLATENERLRQGGALRAGAEPAAAPAPPARLPPQQGPLEQGIAATRDAEEAQDRELEKPSTNHCECSAPWNGQDAEAVPGVDGNQGDSVTPQHKDGHRSQASISFAVAKSSRWLVQRADAFPEAVFFKDEGLAQLIVRSRLFEYVSLLVVFANAIWISVDLDCNDGQAAFFAVENFFVVAFSVELVLRYLAFEVKRHVVHDKWFLFDVALVLAMIIEYWVIPVIVLITHAQAVSKIGILSVVRVFRLLRLARLWRLFFVLPELQFMIAGMVHGIRSVFITMIVLLSLTYVFAIVIRVMGDGTTWGNEYFGSVPEAVYFLVVETILPDQKPLLNQMRNDAWYCAIVYSIFHLLSTVTIMNMLIGILCDVMSRVSEEGQEQRLMAAMADRLQKLLLAYDENYNGYVSRKEFDHIMESQACVKVLQDLGVDTVALADEGPHIFGVPAEQLSFEDFQQKLLLFRPSQEAVMRSVRLVWKHIRETNGRLTAIDVERFRRLRSSGSVGGAPLNAGHQTAIGEDAAAGLLPVAFELQPVDGDADCPVAVVGGDELSLAL